MSIPVLGNDNGLKNFRKVTLLALIILLPACAALFIFESEIFNLFEPTLPMDRGRSERYYRDLIRLCGWELFWAAMIAVVAFLLDYSRIAGAWISRLEYLMAKRSRTFVVAVLSVFLGVGATTATLVLQEFPNSSDEYVYLFQARTLSEGKLWQDSHPVDKSFGFNHIANKDGITVGRFPPGWPMILAAGIVLGIPASLVNPLLATLGLFLFYRLAKKRYGSVVAGWSVLLLAFTSFFIFNAASYFSHTLCLVATIGFVYGIYCYEDKGQFVYAFISGACLGLILLTRYYTALLLFVPVFLIIHYQQRFAAFPLFIKMSIGTFPFLFLLMWYNYEITGNALQPVTMWAFEDEGVGFIKGHTFFKGMEHLGRRLLMFVYWCSPFLLIYYFYALLRKARNRNHALFVPEDYFFVVLIAGYLLYYEIGGNQYGPRFYFEALPFVILFVVFRIIRNRNHWARKLMVASLLIAVIKFPVIAVREHSIVNERRNVYQLVNNAGIRHAVILLTSGTGVTRPMPSGDLTRNDMKFNNDILFAIDHDEANATLMRYYPDRTFYKYQRDAAQQQGRLIRIR